MNFFEKKTYHLQKASALSATLKPPQVKKLFEFEGKYDVEEKNMLDNEDVNQAIQYRLAKNKHTDFFFKLHDLKERIEVFNQVFGTKRPKFMHNTELKK